MKISLGLVITGVLCLSPASAEESIKHWLEKITTAEQFLNYEGTFIYINGPKVETMQIVHGFDEKGERQRITSLTGMSKEVVRDEQHVFSVFPEQRQVLIEPRNKRSDPGSFLTHADGNNPFYEFEINGDERIADYRCKTIAIYPKDQYRYGYRLCIEDKTGLLLKLQTLDKSGQPQEQLIFTNLKLPEKILTEHLQTTMHEEGFKLLQSGDVLGESITVTPDKSWNFSQLPPGFQVKHNEMRQLATSKLPVQHILLEDGLATISVFIAQYEPGEQYSEGVSGTGALNAVSRLQDGFIITVIGEVPGNTVKLVSRSLVKDNTIQ